MKEKKDMIEHWLVTGDKHGNFTWMLNGSLDSYPPQKTAIIILGDAGFDFYLNKTDEKKKKEVDARGYYIYWVRGNHEARASDVKGYEKIFDENVHGIVYCDPRFPHLRAFLDYGFYDINGYICYVIGGAYSVDKYWRLERAMMTEENNNPKKSGWFANEQLTKEEMSKASEQLYMFKDMGKHIHFILSHTCPYEWEPRDMFLGSVDQSTVDDSMERWMDQIKDDIRCDVWCFGHFHADRIERPGVEQYYHDMEDMDVIYNRWVKYKTDKELPWHLVKGPAFYND